VTLHATSSSTSTGTRAKANARAAADSPWVDRLARLGLAARGLVYVMIGVIALKIAFGSRGTQADRRGALHTLAMSTFGKAVVVVAAIGFLGYAVWRLTEAVWGHRDEDGAKQLGKRATSLFRAGLYGWFAISAILLIAGAGTSSSDKTSRTWTARLMGQPFGKYLVIVAGVAFFGAGLALAWRGVTTKFEEKLKVNEMSPGVRRVVETIGLAGNVARGVVFGIVGVFLVIAAVTFDPKKARGLDGSLRVLAGSAWGQVLLVAVALGLVAFGLYSFAESRYRKT
jgi:hypothetical protein